MKTIGIIPARGGSKRLPRKNERLLLGRTLLHWTIECARKCNTLDAFYVSTEDWALGLLAHSMGASIIRRPDELATDGASLENVIRHALMLHPAKFVVLLQPTSPFRLPQDVDECVMMSKKNGETVISYGPNGKNGAVYVCRSEWIQEFNFSDTHVQYFMPEERSIDIDTIQDLMKAEAQIGTIRAAR